MQQSVVRSLLFGFVLLSITTKGQQCFDCGEGINGDFKASHDTIIVGGTYEFSTFVIDPGVKVDVTGNDPLIIRSKGMISIAGILNASGEDGLSGITGVSGGNGGKGTAAGSGGGNGVFTAGNSISGMNGSGTGAGFSGSGWTGGGGAGYSINGNNASGGSGIGGTAYGDIQLSQLLGGSGGGSGAAGFNCGSGGGGAGGGVIVLLSCSSIQITLTGAILSNGGNGGSDGNGNCGGGGGGSGGTIWLGASSVWIAGGVYADGGNGGSSSVAGTPYYGTGANGAPGRIRIDYKTKNISGIVHPNSEYTTIPFIAKIFRSLNAKCYGGASGYAKARANGGTPPYSFLWSTGSTADEISNLKKGIYTVTVTDALGCSQMESVEIFQPEIIHAWKETVLPSCAGGNDGALFAGAFGGSPFPQFQSLGTALYSNGSSNGIMFSIQLTQLVDITRFSLMLDEGQNHDIEIWYKNNGYIGFENNPLAWSSLGSYSVMGVGNESATPIQLSVPKSLQPGIYSFYIYNKSGKINTLTGAGLGTNYIFDHCMTLYEGKGRSANPDPFQAGNLNSQFFSGAIKYTIRNATNRTYGYQWNANNNSQEIKNIPAGIYPLVVSDAYGCQRTIDIELPNPDPIHITEVTKINPSCNGENNGSLKISASGGNPEKSIFTAFNGDKTGKGIMFNMDCNSSILINNFKLSITDTGNLNIWYKQGSYSGFENNNAAWTLVGNFITSTVLNDAPTLVQFIQPLNLNSGNYSFYIYSSNGELLMSEGNSTGQIITSTNELNLHEGICRRSGSNPFSATTNGSGILNGCIGYSIPGANFNYQWDNGYTSTTITNLSSGDYKITVTDIGGCSQRESFHLSEPDPILVNSLISSEIDSSSNGSVEISATGGLAPYYYYWPATGTSGPTLSNVEQGNYQVLIVDASGCTSYANANVSRIMSHSIPDAILVLNPVPTTNHIQITKPIEGMDHCLFQLFDDTGRLILNYQTTISALMNEGVYLDRFRDGIYNVVVSDDDQRYTSKAIIVR